MKKVFLDTNVLIDFFQEREPFATNAATIFQLGSDMQIELYCASVSITNIFYIFRRFPKDELYFTVQQLLEHVHVVGSSHEDIAKALRWQWKDFEDCVQYIAAQQSGSDVIVTRNVSDFEGIGVPVMTPGDFLQNGI